ncbi:hypothetical protein COJ96_10870 [Bacillus sp. AFS073361]|uniref:hypothetical protein n=1 Tax=Bacillus sp. AFS073361 TaxID=2033511 RepID=UPI000BF32A8C|nr:hypothetical protein [Bacillus sp. AFS073361]PFP29398.1 hypothetical protein COJ96_10870 [Bacillus sp. AFS073361]
MRPINDPGKHLRKQYEQKLRKLLEKNSVDLIKICVRVLREDFGFTPEQCSRFVHVMEEKLKKE